MYTYDRPAVRELAASVVVDMLVVVVISAIVGVISGTVAVLLDISIAESTLRIHASDVCATVHLKEVRSGVTVLM